MKSLSCTKILIAILASAIFSVSCGNRNEASKSNTANALSESVGEHLPMNFYKRLEGTIANQPVVMQLQCYNGELQGTYYYIKQGKTLSLSGNIDSLHPNNLQLKELDENSEDDSEPELDCVYEPGGIKGSWRSADGTKNYVIDLKEVYAEGSVKFNVFSLEEEAQAIPGVDSSPVATVTKNLLIPENGDDWLSNQIVKMVNADTASAVTDIADAAKKSNAVFIKNYKDEVKDAKGDGLDLSARFGYEDFVRLSVLYNENGFLIIDNSFYSFTGGAHGFGGDSYHCFDMQAKREIRLSDVITGDSLQLQPMMEKAFRTHYELKPMDSLTDILFENHLYPSDNLYFTSTGIAFVYLPYDVAPYAAGSISVFVPYTELKKYIQPWFAKRMHLD